MERRALTASKNAAEPDMVVGAGASAGAGFAWVEEEREADLESLSEAKRWGKEMDERKALYTEAIVAGVAGADDGLSCVCAARPG